MPKNNYLGTKKEIGKTSNTDYKQQYEYKRKILIYQGIIDKITKALNTDFYFICIYQKGINFQIGLFDGELPYLKCTGVYKSIIGRASIHEQTIVALKEIGYTLVHGSKDKEGNIIVICSEDDHIKVSYKLNILTKKQKKNKEEEELDHFLVKMEDIIKKEGITSPFM